MARCVARVVALFEDGGTAREWVAVRGLGACGT
jgi:hypothetical protein